MEKNETLAIMPASVARAKMNTLYITRCKNLCISIEKKIEDAIDCNKSSVNITNVENRYCGERLIEAGYKIKYDGPDVWIEW